MASRPEYEISTDRDRLDLDAIHRFLSTEAYWSPGVTREVVRRSIEHSLPFGVYLGDEQVGFARVVTDRATFAWIADVYIESAQRGGGLGKRLLGLSSSTPSSRAAPLLLASADAHDLYALRFDELRNAGRFMALYSDARAAVLGGVIFDADLCG